MTWADNPINGQNSVSANKAPINNAFQYIADTQEIDHYWDDANANLDGRHRFVQMPKNESGGSPSNPSIGTDIDGVIFVKEKTAAEAPDIQIAEPFYIVNDGTNDQVLQMGFRAICQFQGRTSNGNCTLNYSHNISSIARTGQGLYTITYNTAMPSNKYAIFGSAQRFSSSGSNQLYLCVAEGNNQAASMPANGLTTKVSFQYSGNSRRDPDIAMLVVVGG